MRKETGGRRGGRRVKILVRANSWLPRGKRTVRVFEKVEVREGSEKVNKPEKHRVNFSGS